MQFRIGISHIYVKAKITYTCIHLDHKLLSQMISTEMDGTQTGE